MSFGRFNCQNKESSRKPSVYEDLFYKFFTTNNEVKLRLKEILTQKVDENGEESRDEIYSVDITHLDLFTDYPDLGEHLFTFPTTILQQGNKAVRRALMDLWDEELKVNKNEIKDYKEKQKLWSNENKDCTTNAPRKLISSIDRINNVRIRIYSLPENCVNYIFGAKDVGRFTCLRATVVRTTSPRLLEYSRLYKCSQCKQCTDVEARPENNYIFPKVVKKCPNLCIGGLLKPVAEKSDSNSKGPSFAKLKDFQEIKIQEQKNKVNCGAVTKSMIALLEDDLTDQCKPGDDVEICGTMIMRYKPFKKGQASDAELCFLVNHLQINNGQRSAVLVTEDARNSFTDFWERYKCNPYQGRNFILSSFCPELYGLYVVKLAMSVILAGGVEKEKNGNRIRGESHILLVGDPGTGKSQLLKYASHLCPRSVMTTGIGTTNAGLTVSATKDGSEWQFEPGALVLADGGICCIDEFSCIREQDRVSIHEAMEQQSISVAKAGMVSKLNTRCSILASTNPKGKYDPNESLPVNVALSAPLLSRFDVLLVLRDAENADWDNFICDFTLGKGVNSPSVSEDLWEMQKLQTYFTLIKDLKPTMTPESNEVLSAYYTFQRNSVHRNASRTTFRLLESLVRLSEGHAKLMCHKKVTVQDAIVAVTLLESSMLGSCLLSEVDSLHTYFPEDPMIEYANQANVILEALQLPHLWDKEKKKIDRRRGMSSSVKRSSQENGEPRENKRVKFDISKEETQEIQNDVHNSDDDPKETD